MVRKNRTDMPFCVCPRCNRTSSVGKLYGGNKILYYCADCFIEFSVKVNKEGKGTCEVSYSYGAKITPQRYRWSDEKDCWERINASSPKQKKSNK